MKRKIAAIFAADIAGYSRLVAEDEEETLRRLAVPGAMRPMALGFASNEILGLITHDPLADGALPS